MKVLSKKDIITLKKEGKIDNSINAFAKSAFDEKEEINQDLKVEKILINIAETIQSLNDILLSVSNKNSEVLNMKLTEIIKSFQRIKFPEPLKQVSELTVEDIKHDNYGRMTGFKIVATRGNI